jgi:hypothetical protein
MIRILAVSMAAALALSAQLAVAADSFSVMSPPVTLPTSEELAAGLTSTCSQAADVTFTFVNGETGVALKTANVTVYVGKSVIVVYKSATALKMVFGRIAYSCLGTSTGKSPAMLISRNRKTKVTSFSYF